MVEKQAQDQLGACRGADRLPFGDLEARVNAIAANNPRARELAEKYRADLELIYTLRRAATAPRTAQEPPNVDGGSGRSR